MTMIDLITPSVVVLNNLKEDTYKGVLSFEVWDNHNVKLIFKDDKVLNFENITNIKVK